MDTPLSPRDIQTRIRAGESLEDLVAGSGTTAERIERFAAPVLAEREHLALTALGSSVRRRGEASGHRPLRSVVSERLQAQGVDGDDVRWDAWKVADSSWQLSADYELQGEPRHAEFRFDAQGRFSVAEDDEARWLAGEAPSPVAASDDRDDELALVRATREPSGHDERATTPDDERRGHGATPRRPSGSCARSPRSSAPSCRSCRRPSSARRSSPSWWPTTRRATSPEADAEPAPTDDEPTLVARPRRGRRADHRGRPPPDPPHGRGRRGGRAGGRVRRPTRRPPDRRGGRPLGARHLYDMLGGYAEESPRVYAGLSDAAAVPAVDEHEFEPAATVRVPAEPDPETVEPEPRGRRRAPSPRPSPRRRSPRRPRTTSPRTTRPRNRRSSSWSTRRTRRRPEPTARPPTPARDPARGRRAGAADPQPGRLAQARTPQAGLRPELGRDHVRRTQARLTSAGPQRAAGSSPVATGRAGSRIQSLHEPG